MSSHESGHLLSVYRPDNGGVWSKNKKQKTKNVKIVHEMRELFVSIQVSQIMDLERIYFSQKKLNVAPLESVCHTSCEFFIDLMDRRWVDGMMV